jgi:hypothetical protein
MLDRPAAAHLIQINGAGARLAPDGANGDNGASIAYSSNPEQEQS